jgi:hypothetical protein
VKDAKAAAVKKAADKAAVAKAKAAFPKNFSKLNKNSCQEPFGGTTADNKSNKKSGKKVSEKVNPK